MDLAEIKARLNQPHTQDMSDVSWLVAKVERLEALEPHAKFVLDEHAELSAKVERLERELKTARREFEIEPDRYVTARFVLEALAYRDETRTKVERLEATLQIERKVAARKDTELAALEHRVLALVEARDAAQWDE